MLANRALDIDPSVALLLPCNVALDEAEGGTRVRIVDPRELMDDPRFESLADEAAAKLQAALDELRRSTVSPLLASPLGFLIGSLGRTARQVNAPSSTDATSCPIRRRPGSCR